MGFHECFCHQTPCICGSDQEPVRVRFTPAAFLMLLDHEKLWLELLMRLTRHRATYSEGEAIRVRCTFQISAKIRMRERQ